MVVTDFKAMPRRGSDCSQDLKETGFFPVLFLIDASVYRALAATLMLAMQPRTMTQFKRLIGLSHRVRVSENRRIFHKARSHALLGSRVLQLSPYGSTWSWMLGLPI